MLAMASESLELTEEQVLFFRARRGHLAGDGAAGVAAAARAMLGAQSQQLPPSLLALSLRTAGRPTAAEVAVRLLGPDRDLVRTWGPRDTLHVYDAAADWADVVAAREQWAPGGRRGVMPSEELLDAVRKVLAENGGKATRKDLFDILPADYVAEAGKKIGPGPKALQLAAARPLWVLANRGEVCLIEKRGAEQVYVSRAAWFPDLPWPGPPALEAAVRLTRRYLAVHGPATATDVAHFFGARVRDARGWLKALEAPSRRRSADGSQLAPVRCGDRRGLVALAGDAGDLTAELPATASAWPVRLLPLWESLLMAHADKSWTVPEEAERKLVWRKAGYVAATVLARGRIVATWTHKKRSRRLTVQIEPLGSWRTGKHAAGARREAHAVARHFGLEGADVTIGS